jgi:molybdate transport system substrate-binding protein
MEASHANAGLLEFSAIRCLRHISRSSARSIIQHSQRRSMDESCALTFTLAPIQLEICMPRRIRFCAGLIALLFAACATAEEIHIAVAANFLGTLEQLAPRFRQVSGHTLKISSGASGQFYAQIKNGAPFDVFLSADNERPKQLADEGLAIPTSRFTYAIGKLVLWSPKNAVVDDRGAVLIAGQYRFVAVANPRTAPYGAAAQAVLRKLGLWEKLNADKRVVVGENIGQTFQFVATGNAELGFVALSQVLKDGKLTGSSWQPPESMYPRIEQDAVVLKSTSKLSAANAFLAWLRTDATARSIIEAAGYRVAQP